MKRPIAWMLAIILCLALTACGADPAAAPPEEGNADPYAQTLAQAQELMDGGDYEGAIALLSSVDIYQRIDGLLTQAQSLQTQKVASFLYATWVDVRDQGSFSFQEEGSTLILDNRRKAMEFSYQEGVVTIQEPIALELTVTEQSGITHLVGGGYDLVQEKDYAAAGPQEVAITLDNWQDYFELRTCEDIRTDDNGDIFFYYPGYGIFLREEFADRIVADGSLDVSFQVKYVRQWVNLEGDGYPNGEFSFGSVQPHTQDYNRTGCISPFLRTDPSVQKSDYYGVYAALLFNYSAKNAGHQYIAVMTVGDPEILTATGTLRLLP